VYVHVYEVQLVTDKLQQITIKMHQILQNSLHKMSKYKVMIKTDLHKPWTSNQNTLDNCTNIHSIDQVLESCRI